MFDDRCYHCGRSLGLIPDEEIGTVRENIGFGAANDRTRSFCSTHCRCLWADVDPVLEATHQTTIAAWNGTARDDADRIAWCL